MISGIAFSHLTCVSFFSLEKLRAIKNTPARVMITLIK
jgi:hypothetical protein